MSFSQLVRVRTVLTGFCTLWTQFWVVAVGSGCILLSIRAGPNGFDLFWPVLDVILVVAVSSGCILLSVGEGPHGFDRFWHALYAILGRGD